MIVSQKQIEELEAAGFKVLLTIHDEVIVEDNRTELLVPCSLVTSNEFLKD